MDVSIGVQTKLQLDTLPPFAYGLRVQYPPPYSQVPPEVFLCARHVEAVERVYLVKLTGNVAMVGECEECRREAKRLGL